MILHDEVGLLTHTRKPCCDYPITDDVLNLIDQSVEKFDTSSSEQVELYYISAGLSPRKIISLVSLPSI